MQFPVKTLTAAMVFALAGCNISLDVEDENDDGYPDNGQQYMYGQLIDSPVGGVYYSTESTQGYTSNSGEFKYMMGDNIQFKVGDVALPQVPAAQVITPLELGNVSVQSFVDAIKSGNFESSKAVNIMQFLQSLDEDANPDNGIFVNMQTHEAFKNVVLDFSSANFDADLSSVLTTAGLSLVSEADAIAHFTRSDNNDDKMGDDDNQLIGTWIVYDNDDDTDAHIVTFLPGNKYLLAHEGSDPDPVVGFDSGTVEFGEYEYNHSTGEFKVTSVLADSSNNNGFADGNPKFSFNDQGQLILSATEYNDGKQETINVTFQPISNLTTPEMGSWALYGKNDDGSVDFNDIHVISLLGNGKYVVVHSNNEEAYENDVNVAASSEWGTFTRDADGITVNTPHVDLDGPGGMYDKENIEGDNQIGQIEFAKNGDLILTENAGDTFYVSPVGPVKVTLYDEEGDSTTKVVNRVDFFTEQDIMGKTLYMPVPLAGTAGQYDDVDSASHFVKLRFYDDMTASATAFEDGGLVSNDFSWEILGNDTILLEGIDGFVWTLTGVKDDHDGQVDYGTALSINNTASEQVGFAEVTPIYSVKELTEADITTSFTVIAFEYFDGTKDSYEFHGDGTGTVYWDGNDGSDGFNWRINDKGQLEILTDLPTPEIYTLLDNEMDDGQSLLTNGIMVFDSEEDEYESIRHTKVKVSRFAGGIGGVGNQG